MCKTDLEQMIFNSFQEVCTMKIVVQYSMMLQPLADVYRQETFRM
jgi:hypothetical protein